MGKYTAGFRGRESSGASTKPMPPKKMKSHFLRIANFTVMLRITAVKFDGNENLFRGGKLRYPNVRLGGVHAVAWGCKMKAPRPLHASQVHDAGFVDDLG
ncbi:MAG: hypothetical protein IJ214_00840, partial [Clostridia bacterium]|nr:hypothetical protein [Clostridia bacterium]